MDETPICPLCGRPIPRDVRQSDHHLIPKLKGGKGGPVVRLHQICHNGCENAAAPRPAWTCAASGRATRCSDCVKYP